MFAHKDLLCLEDPQIKVEAWNYNVHDCDELRIRTFMGHYVVVYHVNSYAFGRFWNYLQKTWLQHSLFVREQVIQVPQ